MRIAMFTDTYEPQVNGVVTAIKSFEKVAKELGHEIFVVCPAVENHKFPRNVFACKSFTFKPYPEYRGALPSPEVLEWIKRIDPDVIHVHTPASLGLLGLACARILNKPVVATYHTLLEDYFKIYFLPTIAKKSRRARYLSKKFIKKYTKFFFNQADCVIAPSLAIRKILEECGVKKPVYVIPTGIDVHEFRKVRGISEKEKTVLWVGRLGKEKSLEVLLEAFAMVEERVKNARLVIVGDGPERDNLEKKARELGINARFTGYVKREELPKYYSGAWLLASPSTTETQGLTVLEAMACSCPVVVARALGFRDFVKHGKNGFFAEPKNAKDFARKMIRILQNRRLREKLGKCARSTAEKFSVRAQTERIVELYRKLIGEKLFPLVSVIIPALNEEKYIEKTLKSVKNQTYPRIEIIVVDNGSEDATGKIAKKYADKVVVEKRRGVARARNAGAAHARGEILLFLDADTELERRFVEKMVYAFRDGRTVCATGFVTSEKRIVFKFLYSLSSFIVYLLSVFKPVFPGMVLACRKRAFEEVGGFDENLVTCEDIELAERIGKIGKCRFVWAFAKSSPRRLERHGIVRTTLFHMLNFFRYSLMKKPAREYAVVR